MTKQSTRQALKRREAKRHKRSQAARRHHARDDLAGAGTLAANWAADRGDDGKLSGRIFDIAEAWMEHLSHDVAEVGLGIAVVCWNLAVLGIEASDPLLVQYMASAVNMKERELAGIMHHVRQMVARKHRLYPDDRRFVAHYEVRTDALGWHLVVASTPLRDLSEEARQRALASLGEPTEKHRPSLRGPGAARCA